MCYCFLGLCKYIVSVIILDRGIILKQVDRIVGFVYEVGNCFDVQLRECLTCLIANVEDVFHDVLEAFLFLLACDGHRVG